MSPRIAILDTYYPHFLASWGRGSGGYETELQRLLRFGFGTADFYSRNLRALGWTTMDIVANDTWLQQLWGIENDVRSTNPVTIVLEQLKQFTPDVVFLQDLSFLNNAALEILKGKVLLVGQCSCQMPFVEKVKMLDLVFTSFPHYLPRFRDMDVRALYLPLAFEPDVLGRFPFDQVERIEECSFIGGMGWQWNTVLGSITEVAEDVPELKFWGYNYGSLPAGTPILGRYQGEAWGLDMYRILARSKIVLNRHGAISGQYCNNLRMFEVTGMGALLLTDQKENLHGFFSSAEAISYRSAEEAVEMIHYYLNHEEERKAIASRGQQRTLRDHTYANRMPLVSEAIRALLSRCESWDQYLKNIRS